jgi:Uma2 family endonuclease
LAVVRGKNRDYVRLGRPPEPADVCLVIEVSDSSLSRDRAQKYRAYANGAIPVYWIVNLVDRKVEVYTQPSAGGYQSRHEFGPAQHVPVMIDGANVGQIAVDDIVP